MIQFRKVEEQLVLVVVRLEVQLEIGNDLLVVHALPVRHLIEELVGLHEELWELFDGQRLEDLLANACLSSIQIVADPLGRHTTALTVARLVEEHRVHLEHAEVLHEELVVLLHFQRIAQADLTEFLDDFGCPVAFYAFVGAHVVVVEE